MSEKENLSLTGPAKEVRGLSALRSFIGLGVFRLASSAALVLLVSSGYQACLSGIHWDPTRESTFCKAFSHDLN